MNGHYEVTIPYDRNSPYLFDDSCDAAECICESNQYQENFEVDADDFDEYLNEVYGDVEIAGGNYSTSDALCQVDDYRYGEIRSEYSQQVAQENTDSVQDEIDDMPDDRETEIEFVGGIIVRFVIDEEDDDDYDEDEKQGFLSCFEEG